MTGGFGPRLPRGLVQRLQPGSRGPAGPAGFDWVCLDGQHGVYGRTGLVEAARSYPGSAAELAVRVASNDFAAIGAALDVGATTVIVPAGRLAGRGGPGSGGHVLPAARPAELGPARPDLGGADGRTGAANALTTCAVMVESAAALDQVEAIAAVPGVGCLFVGPYDLSLTLGTTVEAMLDDESPGSPLARISRRGR